MTAATGAAADLQIVDDFIDSDYVLRYSCAASDAECAPAVEITGNGVWFRDKATGLVRSAHRRCLERSRA